LRHRQPRQPSRWAWKRTAGGWSETGDRFACRIPGRPGFVVLLYVSPELHEQLFHVFDPGDVHGLRVAELHQDFVGPELGALPGLLHMLSREPHPCIYDV
jgi:hypothetical protein